MIEPFYHHFSKWATDINFSQQIQRASSPTLGIYISYFFLSFLGKWRFDEASFRSDRIFLKDAHNDLKKNVSLNP